jgi:hypothetical protein
MPRISGKTGKILAVSTRTVVSIAQTMTDVGGGHIVFILTGKPYWDSNLPPVILVDGTPSATAYTVQYVAGTITFSGSIGGGHTVTVNGIAYSTLLEVGDFFNWTIDAKVDNVDATAFQDIWKVKLSTFLGWVASAERYYINSYWFTAFGNGIDFYMQFFPQAASAECWTGNGYIDDSMKLTKDAPFTETIKLEGTGELQYTAP